MSTEQPESSHSQGENTQHVTSSTPTASPPKIPSEWLLANWLLKKTRLAREAQKKAAAEAAVIIANNKTKAPTAVPAATPATEDESPSRSSLSTTQWLAAGSFFISLIGLYYKPEELKAAFSKKTAATQPAPEQQPAHVTPPPQQKGIRRMED